MKILRVFSLILGMLFLFDFSMSAQTSLYEVVSKRLEVLSQPNADAQVIGQKKEHDVVEVFNIVNGWAIIKYENGTGFVDQYCIKSLDEESVPASPDQTRSSVPIQQQKETRSVILKAGTEIPICSDYEIRAKEVKEGQTISFKVSRNIILEGVIAIPSGTLVEGKVYEAKTAGKEIMKINKRTMKEGKGCIGIKIESIILTNSTVVGVEGDVRGKSIYNIAIGRRADIIPAGYESKVKVVSDVTIKINK